MSTALETQHCFTVNDTTEPSSTQYREHQEVFNNIRSTLERIQERRSKNGARVQAALHKRSASEHAAAPDPELEAASEEEDEDVQEESDDRWAKTRKDIAKKVKRRGSRIVMAVNHGQLKLQGKINASLAMQQHRRASISEAFASVKESIKQSPAGRKGKSETGWRSKSARLRPGRPPDSTKHKLQKSAGAVVAGVRHRRHSLDHGVSSRKQKLDSAVSSPGVVPEGSSVAEQQQQQSSPLMSLVEARPVDKVPLRVRLLDDVILGTGSSCALSSGDRLTVLKVESDVLVRFQSTPKATSDHALLDGRPPRDTFEESAAHLNDLCHFQILPSCPEHEGQRYNTVSDVMAAVPSPPDRVRVLGGYCPDSLGTDEGVEPGDVLLVGTATCVKNGRECAVWFRAAQDIDGQSSHENGGVVARREPVLLPLTADCGFCTDFGDTHYSLSQLADQMQAGLLSTPCRVAVVHSQHPGASIRHAVMSPHAGRRLLAIKVTPTHNLLLTDGSELMRMPRGLSAKVHCLQLPMDSKTMLRALQVMVEGGEYTRIRTLRPSQPNSLTALLQQHVLKTTSLPRRVAALAPSPPKTPRGGIHAGGVPAETLAASLKTVMAQDRARPDSAQSESGLGSDSSCVTRPVSVAANYASIDDLNPAQLFGGGHLATSPGTSSPEPRTSGRSTKQRRQTHPNQHDMLRNQLSQSPHHRVAAQSPSLACSSLSSCSSPRSSPRRRRWSSGRDDEELTTVTASMVTLMTGCSAQRLHHLSRTSSPTSPRRVRLAPATYDVPRNANVTSPDAWSTGAAHRSSEPGMHGARVARPSRPPPPAVSAQAPASDNANASAQMQSDQRPVSSIRANSLGRSKRKLTKLNTPNRFNSANRSRSQSPATSSAISSISAGITPEMATHWRTRCEQLRAELQGSRRELETANAEIHQLKQELNRARATTQPPVTPPPPPPTSTKPGFTTELSERLNKLHSVANDDDGRDTAPETPRAKRRQSLKSAPPERPVNAELAKLLATSISARVQTNDGSPQVRPRLKSVDLVTSDGSSSPPSPFSPSHPHPRFSC